MVIGYNDGSYKFVLSSMFDHEQSIIRPEYMPILVFSSR